MKFIHTNTKYSKILFTLSLITLLASTQLLSASKKETIKSTTNNNSKTNNNNNIKTNENPTDRKNFNARDVAMEAIVQNTATVANEKNTLQSDLDVNYNRYQVLGPANGKTSVLDRGNTLYGKDPKAYYPYVNKDKPAPQVPKIEPPPRVPIYELDKKAYYSPNPEYRTIPSPDPREGKVTRVDMANNFVDKFASMENIETLRKELEAIKVRENYFQSFPITDKGVYFKDPNPYYDPTMRDTKARVHYLESTIASMDRKLRDEYKEDFKVKLKTETVTPKVQNQVNMNAEARNNWVMDSYYTPVGKDDKLNDKEYPNGTKLPQPPKVDNVGFNKSKVVEADVNESLVVQADEVNAHKLPWKYVKDKETPESIKVPGARKNTNTTTNTNKNVTTFKDKPTEAIAIVKKAVQEKKEKLSKKNLKK